MSSEAVKPYKLRELSAQDIFSMSRIIKKIGVANFKKCLDGEEMKAAIAEYMRGEKEGEKKDLGGLTVAGIDVTFEIASVIFDRLPECETEIYAFLSSLSGLKILMIQKLPMACFFDMIIDVIKKPEFKDFFKRASRLFS
jgi:hypothetical protein